MNFRPSLTDWQAAKNAQTSMRQDAWLRVGGVKGFMDGALGAGTAVMFEPFTDDPGNTGVYAAEAIPLSKIEERIAGADAAGLQVEVHAIGDKAIAELFDMYARVAKKNGPKDRRFRIEHAQHMRRAEIPRFAEQRRHRVDAAVPRRRRRPLGGSAAGRGRAQPRHLCLPVASRREGARWRSARTGTSRPSRPSSASPPP